MDFDDFFDSSVSEHATLFRAVRATVFETYPAAVEKISHDMPAWKTLPKDGGKIFLYAAAQPKHFGLYTKVAVLNGIRASVEAQGFPTGEGVIRLPYSVSREVLTALVAELVRLNVEKQRLEKELR